MEETREEMAAVSKLWWLSLVAGVLWFFIAIVILQMDSASVTTVGVIVGAMFIGRIGPLTLLLALTSKRRHVPYAYPQETVLIG